MTFAQKIQKLRKDKNEISQAQLAVKLKISQSRVARLELGGKPYAVEIVELAKYSGESINYFLGIEEKSGNFMCGWPDDTVKYCEKLKKVLENKEDSAIIKKMIDAYADKNESKATPKKGSEKKVMSFT